MFGNHNVNNSVDNPNVLRWVGGFSILVVYCLLCIDAGCKSCLWGSKTDWVCWVFGVSEKSRLVEYLGWMAAGGISIYLAWVGKRRADAQDEIAKAQGKTADAMHKTVSVSLLSSSRERFQKGLRHFGSKQGRVRVGGAHEMFLASLEDGMESYTEVVAGVVCQHIRDKTTKVSYKSKHLLSPSPEIRCLLEFMFVGATDRQRENVENFWMDMRADLSDSHLAGCELGRGNFKDALLEGVCFNSAKLRQARFYGAKLGDSKFVSADLKGAAFMGAEMPRARFWGAELEEARFQGSYLGEAEFMYSNLNYTQFMGAEMPHACFQEAKRLPHGLQRWCFRGAFTEAEWSLNPPTDFEGRLREGMDSGGLPCRPKEPVIKLRPIRLKGGLDEKCIKHIAEEVAEFRLRRELGKRKMQAGILCFLRKHRWGANYDVKPNDEWEELPKEQKHYSEEDVKGWKKDYEENKETQLLSESEKASLPPHQTSYLLLPPD